MRPLLHKKLGGKWRRPAFNTPATAPVQRLLLFFCIKQLDFLPDCVLLEGFSKIGPGSSGCFASLAVNGAQSS